MSDWQSATSAWCSIARIQGAAGHDESPEKYNATDAIAHTELVNVWRDIDGDDTVNCVIIQGAGGKVFSAGGDFDLIEKNMKDYNAAADVEGSARHRLQRHQLLQADRQHHARPRCRRRPGRRHLADVSIASKKAKIIDGHTRLGVAAGDHAVIVAPALRHGQGEVLPYLRGGRRRGAERMARVALRRGRPLEPRPEVATKLAEGRRPDPLHQVRAQQLAAHDGPVLRRLHRARDAGLHGAGGEGRRLAPREAQAQVRSLLSSEERAMRGLQGKNVIVTGGGGRSAGDCRRFADYGAKVGVRRTSRVRRGSAGDQGFASGVDITDTRGCQGDRPVRRTPARPTSW